MADELVVMTIDGGSPVLVQVADDVGAATGIEPASIDDVVQNAVAGFDAAIDAISGSASRIVTKLRGVERPVEVTLVFGIKITAEAGAIIAKTGGEANFSVTMKWSAEET
jgi:hypothetical protein